MPLRLDSHACAAQLRAGEIARRRAHSARARPPPRSESTGRLGSLVRGMQSQFRSINGSLSISLQRTFGQLFSPLIRTTLPENPGITLPPHVQSRRDSHRIVTEKSARITVLRMRSEKVTLSHGNPVTISATLHMHDAWAAARVVAGTVVRWSW
jgi:hypothetical protein